MARRWSDRKGVARLGGLAGWSGLVGFRGLAAPGTLERRYLRWSMARVSVVTLVVLAGVVVVGESLYWATAHDLPLEAIGARWAHKFVKPLPFSELVRIPTQGVPLPDTFSIGSESEREIAHPFYLGATEVTFEQYDAFCEATGHPQPQYQDSGWGRDDRPVINVSWDDARAFANWQNAMTGSGCRLPSEAEWEYAARAGTTTEFALPAPDGSDDIAGKGLANCEGCGGEWDDKDRTAPVGSFEPNAWGLYDMHGNVREWVEDCWHESYEGAPEDGRPWLQENDGDCGFRVLRGGSWGDARGGARSAFRYGYSPVGRLDLIGFRVLCSSPIVGH